MKDKIVIILSGGIDSTTLLYDLYEAESTEIYALTFNYGQKHWKEIFLAMKTCKKLGINHKIVHLENLREIMYSSLTSQEEVPEGHYEGENMKSTVVPNRNMVMLAIATSYALTIGANYLYYGAHSGDHEIYPDCRPGFISAIREAIRICDYNKVELKVPYIYHNKGEIIAEGLSLGVPYEDTWTCYNGREKACGKCGSCIERLEAFKMNNITDPIEYEDK